MSEFYESIVEYYERIFVPGEKQLDFLEESAAGSRILDIACGTGAVAQALSERGFDVTAVDLEPEMVKRAQEKPGIEALVGNMLELNDLEPGFDLIYCIGNSMPHLDNVDEVVRFLENSYRLLDKCGNIVLQWINFEPFLKKSGNDLGGLSTIEAEGLSFERKYFRENDKIRFHTILAVDGRILENDEYLLSINLKDVLKSMEVIGFSDIQIYSGFDKKQFIPEDESPIVIRASK